MRSGAGALWQELVVAINDSVKTYNEEFGEVDGCVTTKPNGETLTLSRIAFTGSATVHRTDEMLLFIAMDTDKATVTASVAHEHLAPVPNKQVSIDVSRQGGSELVLMNDGKEISFDEASEVLIKEFLLERKFSKRPL